jgi:acyl-coenzyme A synthetase/AMP-(fatty) acid ligase
MVATAQASVIADVPGGVGYVVPGVHVDIVDAAGKALPAGEQGRVRVRSIYGCDSYFPLEGQSPRFREQGFYPGDLGLLTNNGMLVIGGRENAVINLGGEKVSPERVEAAINSYKGVRDAAAFLASTPVGARFLGSAIVWREQSDEAGLREHLQRELPPYLMPQVFLAVDAVPRNAAGKIDRGRLTQVVTARAAVTAAQ